MASDNLNQAGKSIRKIKEDADYASKKIAPNRRIERSRDVFDTSVPFDMEFRTHHEKDHVSLDLKFTKPPPRKGCNAECFSNNCQTYTFADGLDHIINVGVPYIPNTVIVFRNRTKLTYLNFSETDPEGGLVFVQGEPGTNEITVCFVTGDCIQPAFDAGCYSQHLLVGWSGGEEEGFCTIPDAGPGADSFCGSADTIRLYNGGCVYRIEYRVRFPGTEWYFIAGMPVGGMGTLVMGGTQNNEGLPPVPYATFFITTGGGAGTYGETNVGLFAQPRSPGFSGAFGEIEARVYFVSGPDPRFTDLGTICGAPTTGQTVINDVPQPIGSNIWRTAYPFVLGTLVVTVNGTPVPITEHSDQTFIFVTNPVGNETILATYEAA